MGWQRTGTVSVANGSTSVTGTGTAFTLSNVGDSIVFAGDTTQTTYEITGPQTNNQLTSDTALTITPAYAGTTITNGAYKIMPLQPATASVTLANRIAALIQAVNSYVAGALSGLFGDGTNAAPGIAFANETTTGFRRAAVGALAMILQGTERARWTNAGLGIGMAPTNVLDITQAQNSGSTISILNNSTGTAALAQVQTSNGTARGTLFTLGTNYTSANQYIANDTILEAVNGDLDLSGAGLHNINFWTNSAKRGAFDTNGNFLVGATAAPTGVKGLCVNIGGGWCNLGNNVAGVVPPTTQGLGFGWNYSSGLGESIVSFSKGGGSGGGLRFVDGSSGSYLERGQIDGSGGWNFGNIPGDAGFNPSMRWSPSSAALRLYSATGTTGLAWAARLFSSNNNGSPDSTHNLTIQVPNAGAVAPGSETWANAIVASYSTLFLSTNGSERARINFNGSLLVGATSTFEGTHTVAFNAAGSAACVVNNNTSGTNNYVLDAVGMGASTAYTALIRGIVNGNTPVFQVTGSGNVQNANNSYGALSDPKIKTAIVKADSQWNDVKALAANMVKYKLIADPTGEVLLGLVSRDVTDINGVAITGVRNISPSLVGTMPDTEMQSVQETDADGNPVLDDEGHPVMVNKVVDLGTTTDHVKYSIAFTKALKALGEALERIETLEAQVAALQSH